MAFNIKPPLIVWACLALVLGTALSFAASVALQTWAGFTLSGVEVCLVGGVLAALLGYVFGLPLWWIPLNGIFPIATFLLLSTAIPVWVYLGCFLVLLLFYWNSARDRVPLYLTNSTTWRALADQIRTQNGPFIDLGCGLGGTLFHLAHRFPERTFVGIESAPMPFLWAKVRKWLTRSPNVEILYGDFWGLDLNRYDTVYAFLSPAPMQKLYEKVAAEMPAGGQFISNSFAVPDRHPTRFITLADSRQTRLLIWQF